ncbi:MAG: restriction endonuclease [Bacteroidetes bacterium]|jgi:5-methylcytosine-specific restriction enzyme subunit McrC|nr:restriction endonuclease [Bacteroidota bacterium]MBT5531166.1 restriction endonuclease [Cytophagia bacterium]MBT6051915.1 restriction endonuclease [Candidatus Scalindua sp.]MBT7041202.1 restriction endonuclease [Bacteroidota bacterium]
MSRTKNILQVFEHQTLKVDEDSPFKMVHFNVLEKYGYRTNEKYFSVGNKRIKFNNYVGVIQVKNLTVEILPKADNKVEDQTSKDKWHNALITMLKECKLIKLNTISNAKLKLKSTSILDLYYDLFLSETETIFKHGLRKNYRSIKVNLNKVKGKILFTNHIRKNAFHKERFYVEHKIFDADNKLNQILLKALLVLKIIGHNPNHNIRINKLLLNFDDVSKENITEKWFEKLTFDRNTERYRQAITLAKLIIIRYSPDLKGGNENVLAITFDMNMLYENYVYRKLKALQMDSTNPIVKVKEQNRTPFWESRGLRADIVVETEDKGLVIDTKWKVLKDNKPSDGDLKQMFVYNLHYNTDLSILLYPKMTLESSKKKPFRNEKFKAINCQVAFANLFNNEGKLEKELGLRIYNEILKEELKTGANNVSSA